MAKPGVISATISALAGYKLAMSSNFKDAISGVLFEGLK